MKLTRLLALLLIGITLHAAETQPGQIPGEVKVRIYSMQPPESLNVAPGKSPAMWRSCATCRPAKVSGGLQVNAIEGRVRVAGQPQTYASIFLSGSYRLTGSQHAPFEAGFPLEIRASGNWLLLNLTVPLEQYVSAVLAAESGNRQSDQSLQAMAVAARTFAVHFRGRHKIEAFDFCDTTHCQDFRFSAINEHIRAAVEATEGELLWYQGRPAATYYHQNCGGNTADVTQVWAGEKLPYLREHVDPYCARTDGSVWHSNVSKADLQKALVSAGLHPPSQWQVLQIVSRSPAGRVRSLRFTGDGAAANQTIPASSLRFAVGRSLGWNQIRSDLYDLRQSGDELIFTGRGSGHGVGLCQTGAAEMGKQGKNYREILAFYYPGTTLGLTAQGLSWQSQSGERLELLTTRGREDSPLIPVGERLMHEAESATGLTFDFRPRLKIYPTLDTYRDATAEPGWVGADSYGRTIRLQPAELLRERAALDSTLRHEFVHLLVESHARPGLPLWFREGVVLYLATPAQAPTVSPANSSFASMDLDQMFQRGDRQQMEQAYAMARARVAELVQQKGKVAVMSWIYSREGAPF